MRTPSLVAAVSAVALLPALALAPAATAAPAAQAVKVTLQDLPASSDVGTKVTVAGTAKDGTKKVKVTVQRRYGASAWQTVGTDTTDKKGKYSLKVALVQGGPTSFRVKAGGKVSKVESLAVYEWLELAEQPHVFGASIAAVGVTSRVGGRSLPASFESYSGDLNLVWAVAGCTTFRGWTGFLDSEASEVPDGATQELGVRMIVDPATSPAPTEYTTPVGAAVLRTRAVPAGTRFLHATVSASATAVLGTPQARCNAARLSPVRYADVFGEPGSPPAP